MKFRFDPMSEHADIETHLADLEKQFPKGSVAWHKATGQAFVVVGHGVDDSGALVLRCDGGGRVAVNQNPLSMQPTPPANEGGDDDD